MATGAEPVRPPGWRLFAEWHALIEHGDPRFTFLAHGDRDGRAGGSAGSPLSGHSMWNMLRHYSIYAMRDSVEAMKGCGAGGSRFASSSRGASLEHRSPLASSHEPELRLAPVAHPMMVLDARLVLVGDSTGETVWTSTDAGVVERAVGFYEWLWNAAEPAVPEGEEPPFTPSHGQIAFLLVDGATDREIARSLGVSERTVSADIREMALRLGVRSRAQVIARISGHRG